MEERMHDMLSMVESCGWR